MLETRLRTFSDSTGGPGPVYAQTGDFFLVYGASTSLTAERIIAASDNITIVSSGTSFLISANTGTPVVYAPTGGEFLTYAANGTLSAERIIAASDNITIVSSGTSFLISANTGVPVVYAPTGGEYLVYGANAILTSERVIAASDNITIVSSGTSFLISATTGDPATSIVYAQTGDLFLTYGASTGLSAERVIAASDNITIVSSGTSFLISATTSARVYAATDNTYVVISAAGDLTAERVLTASTGLTLTDGGAGANAALSVNINVRQKAFTFFAAGNLSTSMLAEETRIFIPFTMEASGIRLTVTGSPTGSAITCNLVQFAIPNSAGIDVFSPANRPIISNNTLVGSAYTLSNGTLYAGSYLGFSIDGVGTTLAGSNLTITVLARTS